MAKIIQTVSHKDSAKYPIILKISADDFIRGGFAKGKIVSAVLSDGTKGTGTISYVYDGRLRPEPLPWLTIYLSDTNLRFTNSSVTGNVVIGTTMPKLEATNAAPNTVASNSTSNAATSSKTDSSASASDTDKTWIYVAVGVVAVIAVAWYLGWLKPIIKLFK